MAREWESQKKPTQGLGGLYELIDAFSSFGKESRERQNKGFASMYKQFSLDSNSYDNAQLNTSRERFLDYFNENRGNMDDQTLDMFDLLDEEYKQQEKLNTDYEFFMDRHQQQSDEIIRLTEQFNNANNAENFTYNTVSFNSKGERVETPNIVSAPTREAMGFTDWESWDVGPKDEFNRSPKEQEYFNALNEFNVNIGEEREIYKYTDDKRDFLLKHSERKGNPLFAYDFQKLQSTEDVYNFALQSAKDDGIFDEEEKNAYMTALGTGNSQYIADFKAKDRQISNAVANQLSTSIQENFAIGEQLNNHLDIFKDVQFANILSEDWLKKSNLPSGIQLPIGEDVQNYSNQDVYDVLKGADMNHPLYQYFKSIPSTLQEVKEDLNTSDKSFVNNSGVSLLSKMKSTNLNWDAQTKNLSATLGGQIAYTKPGGTQSLILDDKPTDKKKPAFILLDEDKQVENIKKTSYKTSARNKVKGINNITIKQNEIQEQLNNIDEDIKDNPLIQEYEKDLISMEKLKGEIDNLKESKSNPKLISSKIRELKAYEYKWSEDRIAKPSYEDLDIFGRRKALMSGDEQRFMDEVRPSPGIYTGKPSEELSSAKIKKIILMKQNLISKLNKLTKEKEELESHLGKLKTYK